MTATGLDANNTMQNDDAAFGECLKLPYYCGQVEQWMIAMNIFFIIINIISCLITLVANALFLVIYFGTRSLQSPHYFFIMLLAITDISVGLVSQPLLIARKFMEIYNVHDCVLWTAMRSTVYYFSGISFLTITLVSVERWFAVCKPIKHRRDVTSTRMGVVASVVWSAWFIFPVVRFAVPKFYRAFAMLIGGIIIIVFIINAMLYVKIHRSVREGKLKFTSEAHEKRSKDNVNFRKEGRLAKTVALLLVIMVSAYLPTAIGLTYKALRGVNTIYLFVFLPLADTLVLMNSSFNPLFYCYRNAKIRMEFLKRLNIQTASKNCDSSLNNRSTSKV